MQKFFKRISIFASLLALTFPTFSNGANFGVKPAYPREENPRTESIFVQNIDPGESKPEGVKVINSMSEQKNLILYARDSVRSSGGGFACDQLLEESSEVGSWIKFDILNLEEDIASIRSGELPNTVEIKIPGGTEVVIPFSITTPKDVSVGEHNGCVLIQEIKQKSEEVGVSLSLRSGLRVAITVPGKVVRKLELTDFKIEKGDGSIYLRPSVKNTGNVSIDTNVGVKVKYFFGLNHSNFGGEFPVLRDETYDFNFELKKPFWGGIYSATTVFEYDENEGASIGLTTGEKLTKVKSNTKWFFSTPTIFGLIIEVAILMIALVVFAIWRLSKKKQKWIKKWIPYTVQKDDSLEKLSRSNKVHWEILAEVNKIQAPYTLREGDILKVPPIKKHVK